MRTTIETTELDKFAQHAKHWWDQEGPLKTLHDINPARMNFIRQYMDLKNKCILDVGCGGGILSEALANAGAMVTAIDAESSAIEAARQHVITSKLNIEYHHGAIETFEAPLFDGITCLEMLEHVAEPSLVIQHCARLLKPGGFLFLSTINRTLKAYATAILGAEYILSLLPRQTHDYKKFIRPSELAAMCRHAGFDVQDIQGMSYDPFGRKAALSQDVNVNYLMVSVLSR